MLKKIGAFLVGGTTFAAAWIGAIPQILDWYTGFDPEYSIGGLALAIAPTELTDDKVAIYMRAKINNESSDSGCISDLAVLVTSLSGTETRRWFFPTFFVDVGMFMELSKDGVDTSASISGAFSRLYMSASSSIDREIAFMHRPLNGKPESIMKIGDFEPGVYEADIFVAIGDASCMQANSYEKIFDMPISIELTETLRTSLGNGMIITPLPQDRDQDRTKLMNKWPPTH